jgi:diguanylate cyclase (GGDEF)-like protein
MSFDRKFFSLRFNYLAKLYFWLIFILGLIFFVYALFNLPFNYPNQKIILEFLFFVVLNIASEIVITKIPTGGSLTPSFSIVLTVLIVQGPIYAIISSIIGAAISNKLIQKKTFKITLFNIGLFSIIFTFAGIVTTFLKTIFPMQKNDLLVSIFVIVTIVTILYMILSTIIVDTYIYLSTGVNYLQILKEDKFEMIQLIVLLPISVLGVYFYYSIGVVSTLAAFLPTIVIVYAIKNYLNINELNNELKEFNDNLEKLYEINEKIIVNKKYKQLWLVIIDESRKLIPYDHCYIYMIDDSHTKLILQESDLLYMPQDVHDLLDEGPLQTCVAKRKTYLDNNFKAIKNYDNWKNYKSILVEPIIIDNEIIGVISFLSLHKEGFNNNHIKFSNLLTSSIENTIKNIQLYEETQKQSLVDGLTGIYNQKYFKMQLEAELNRAFNHNYKTSLIMIDVDYFKKFNDTHGHLLGDLVLKEVASILKKFVKINDVLARYGGEEFAILIPETDMENACKIAEQIRQKVLLHKFLGRDNQEVKLSVSIGVYTHNPLIEGKVNKEDFIDRADTALYRAKNEGRNQVYKIYYSEEISQLIVKPYSKKDFLNINKTKFTLSQESCNYWINSFEKFDSWFDLEVKNYSREININYKNFFIEIIINKLKLFHDKEKTNIFDSKYIEETFLSNLKFPTDFYKFEIEIEDIEKAIFDYIAIIKASEIEKDFIRKIVISIFNKVYAVAIQYTSNHYEKIVEYHTNIEHINSELGSISTKQTFYSNITKLTTEILNIKSCLIAEIDSSKRFFEVKSLYSIDEINFLNSILQIDNLIQRVIKYGDLIIISNEENTVLKTISNEGNILIVPLLLPNKEVVGFLACFSFEKQKFTEENIKICREIAQRVVKAIVKIERHLLEKENYLELIKTIIDIYESKTIENKNHSKEISRISARIGNILNLPIEEQNELRNVAYLHDIGKIAILDNKLNDEIALKVHPLIGARIINVATDLKHFSNIIKHHHEYWNGTGYPDGLQGNEIPFFSRIICIANYYNDYLNKYSNHKKAIEEMKNSGLFDPEICNKILEANIYNL